MRRSAVDLGDVVLSAIAHGGVGVVQHDLRAAAPAGQQMLTMQYQPLRFITCAPSPSPSPPTQSVTLSSVIIPSSTKPEKSGFISLRRTLYGLPASVAKTQKRPSSCAIPLTG